MPIDRFLFTHIAVFRPRKRVFHILEWSSDRKHWFPYTGRIHPNDMRLNKSLDHTTDSARIPTRRSCIDLIFNGTYLKVADYEGRTVSTYIPVCTASPNGVLPSSLLICATPYPTCTHVELNSKELWIPQPLDTIRPKNIPPRAALILAQDAASRGDVCPISLDVIQPETAQITSCFHVFTRDSIVPWLATHSTCPVCKEPCTSYPTA
jgi:hypothetical protein